MSKYNPCCDISATKAKLRKLDEQDYTVTSTKDVVLTKRFVRTLFVKNILRVNNKKFRNYTILGGHGFQITFYENGKVKFLSPTDIPDMEGLLFRWETNQYSTKWSYDESFDIWHFEMKLASWYGSDEVGEKMTDLNANNTFESYFTHDYVDINENEIIKVPLLEKINTLICNIMEYN